jgi:hypothetical protein
MILTKLEQMKQITLLLAVAIFLTLSAFECNSRKDCCVFPICSEKSTLSGTWRLEAYENQTTGIAENDPQPEDKGVVFTFADDEKQGTIEGHTFVNTVNGSYTLDKNCGFKVVSFGGSKVGEPEWSKKAWLPSSKSGYYQVVGDKLIIYLNGSEERLRFVKM